MTIKDTFEKEKKSLAVGTKPYETASFLLFILLIGYQWFSIANMYIYKWANNFTTYNTALINLPNFVERFYNLASPIGHVLAPIIYVLYLILVYVLVWWYCNKRGHAKWTWTVIVLFSPNIFLISPLVLYAAYAFRVYLYRFIKGIIVDFKNFDLEKDTISVEEEVEMLRVQKEYKEAQKAEKKGSKNKVEEPKEETKLEPEFIIDEPVFKSEEK